MHTPEPHAKRAKSRVRKPAPPKRDMETELPIVIQNPHGLTPED